MVLLEEEAGVGVDAEEEEARLLVLRLRDWAAAARDEFNMVDVVVKVVFVDFVSWNVSNL